MKEASHVDYLLYDSIYTKQLQKAKCRAGKHISGWLELALGAGTNHEREGRNLGSGGRVLKVGCGGKCTIVHIC